MKLASVFIVVVALCSPVAADWDLDPRCPGYKKRRALKNALNETDDDFALDSHDDFHYTTDTIEFNNSHGEVATIRGSEVYHRELSGYTSFQLKMYWREGYCWQEEWRERKWCMECHGSSCDKGDLLWVQKCSSSSRQRFIYKRVSGSGGGKIIPYSKRSLCLEHTGSRTHQLMPCRDTSRQIFLGVKTSGPFEIHPKRSKSKCLDQDHHPKPREYIRADKCSIARKDHTSKWIMINKKGGSGDDDDDYNDDDDDDKKVNYKGSSGCSSSKPCGRCEGDCDKHSHCKGNLKCYQRDRGDSVPGCSISSKSKKNSRSDFCVDPDDY